MTTTTHTATIELTTNEINEIRLGLHLRTEQVIKNLTNNNDKDSDATIQALLRLMDKMNEVWLNAVSPPKYEYGPDDEYFDFDELSPSDAHAQGHRTTLHAAGAQL